MIGNMQIGIPHNYQIICNTLGKMAIKILQGMIPTAKCNALDRWNTLVSEMCGEKIRNTFGKKYGITGQHFLLYLRL